MLNPKLIEVSGKTSECCIRLEMEVYALYYWRKPCTYRTTQWQLFNVLFQQNFTLYIPLPAFPHTLWICFPLCPFFFLSYPAFVRFCSIDSFFCHHISTWGANNTLSKNNFHFPLPRASAGSGTGNTNLLNASILRISHLWVIMNWFRMVLITSQDF